MLSDRKCIEAEIRLVCCAVETSVLHCDRHRYETVPWNDCDAGCCLIRWMLADPRNQLECWNAVNHCPGLDRLLTRSVLDIVLIWLFSSHVWVSSVLQGSLHMSHSECGSFRLSSLPTQIW